MAKYLGVPAMIPGGPNPSHSLFKQTIKQVINTTFDVTSADITGAYYFESKRGLKCSWPPDEIEPVKLLEPPPSAECSEENIKRNKRGDQWIDVKLPHLGPETTGTAVKPRKPEKIKKKPEKIKKKPKTGLVAAGLGLGVGVAAGALSGADGDGAKPEPERSSEVHGGEAGGESADQEAARLRRKLLEEEYRQRVYEEKKGRLKGRLDQLNERWRQLIDQEAELFKKQLDLISKGEGSSEEYKRLRLKWRQLVQQQKQIDAQVSRHIEVLGQVGQVLLDVSSNIRSLMRETVN